MLPALRQFCERRFGLMMSLALVVGLFVPALGRVPDFVPPVILGVMLIFSYSKIELSHLNALNVKEMLAFYGLRFLLYPALLFGFCSWILPDYRYAVLLLALLPSAVSAAAMAVLMRGNATLALTGTLLSGLLAPFFIPLAFALVEMEVALDIRAMLLTTAALIFLPGLFYFLIVARFVSAKRLVQDNTGFASVSLFSVFIVIVVARLSPQIWAQDPLFLAEAGVVLALVYGSFYALAWLLTARLAPAQRISYTLLSGCNNMGLGVSLALLYFPARENIYIIICEFLWVFLLSGFKFFLSQRQTTWASTP